MANEPAHECCQPKRTELVWEGKRTQVERVALPFQVVETVNVSRATREETPLLAAPVTNPATDHGGWRNKLIWGDNKYVLASLLEEFAGKVDLICIDPPFATGQDFSFRVQVGDQEFVKQPSIIEEKAYRDTWSGGLGSYLQIMYERLVLMRELLADTGSIFVHCDWHVSHYLKACLDEIFGYDNFVNEVAVNRGRRKNLQKQFSRISSLGSEHDVVLVYRASSTVSYNLVKSSVRASEAQWQAFWRGNVQRPTMQYELLGFKPTRGQFLWSRERALRAVENYQRFEASGQTDLVSYWEQTGRQLEFVRKSQGRAYPEYWLPSKEEGIIGDVWLDIQGYSYAHNFDTEKHEDLLERIIQMASGEGNLVADLFCGSGTTPAVAEKLRRRWIACDLSRFAIQVTRKRLLDIPDCRPFEVLNLGKYERQHWQVHVNGGGASADGVIARYLDFIIDLYRAERMQGFTHLHGRKAGRMVHVGATDAPVTLAEITEALDECAANNLRGLDVLGWEWEMGLHDLVPLEARKRGVDLRLLTIPREVMDKRAVEAGDVHFYELAYLDAEVGNDGSEAQVALRNFVIPNEELIPQDVRDKIKRWSDYVDFWAVDWDYQGDTFHNAWQSYRTRKKPTLQLESDPHNYDVAGRYQVMVKVIDIFGNDTTKLISVTVP